MIQRTYITFLNISSLGELGAAAFVKLGTQKFLSPADMFFAICSQLKSIHYVKILIHNQKKLKATLNMHRKRDPFLFFAYLSSRKTILSQSNIMYTK